MPLIAPLAMLGAAPSTTTNIALVGPNSRIANGNQEIEGMVAAR